MVAPVGFEPTITTPGEHPCFTPTSKRAS